MAINSTPMVLQKYLVLIFFMLVLLNENLECVKIKGGRVVFHKAKPLKSSPLRSRQ